MAYIAMAYIVMVYIVMAYVVMAYIAMAYIVMVYIVIASQCNRSAAQVPARSAANILVMATDQQPTY